MGIGANPRSFKSLFKAKDLDLLGWNPNAFLSPNWNSVIQKNF